MEEGFICPSLGSKKHQQECWRLAELGCLDEGHYTCAAFVATEG